jgi:hypothetical protein
MMCYLVTHHKYGWLSLTCELRPESLSRCNGKRSVVVSNSHKAVRAYRRGRRTGSPNKGASAMTVLLYNNHYISVLLTPDKSGVSAYNAVVEIRNKRENHPAARLIIGEAFASVADASTRGVEIGKKWIDERQSNQGSRKRVFGW